MTFLAAALAVAAGSAVPAGAAEPRPGSVLTGSAAGQPIKIKVAGSGRTVTVTLRCGKRRILLQNLPLAGGRFSGDRNEASARRNPVAHVEGRFVSASRAKGRFAARRCDTRRGKWTARRR
jgi:hypothetical protein